MNETDTPSASGLRADWIKIRGLRQVTVGHKFNFSSQESWSLAEVRTARASVKLCRLFGVRSWCVSNPYDASRYLPLYFFIRERGPHLSLMGCYSDTDKVLSDRSNQDMFETNLDLFRPLARLLFLHRPKCLVAEPIIKQFFERVNELMPFQSTDKLMQARKTIIKMFLTAHW